MVGPATAPSDSLRRRVRALHDRLAETYGPPEKPRLDPLDELMQTILSQNTSDTNRDRAYAALRSRFPDWTAVLNAPREEVEEAIRPAGLWQQKARVLQETLASILEDQGELDLSVLDEMSNDEALDYLTGFRGVGIKTAACVLCFALGRDYMPVDTHVHRVSKRLGLIDPDTTANRAHDLLNSDDVVPPTLRFRFHIELIRHGRAVCKAGRPRCEDCVLEDLCPRIGVTDGDA